MRQPKVEFTYEPSPGILPALKEAGDSLHIAAWTGEEESTNPFSDLNTAQRILAFAMIPIQEAAGSVLDGVHTVAFAANSLRKHISNR